MDVSIVRYRIHRLWRWAVVTDDGIAGFLTHRCAARWAAQQGTIVRDDGTR